MEGKQIQFIQTTPEELAKLIAAEIAKQLGGIGKYNKVLTSNIDLPISDLNISFRCYNCLTAYYIDKISDLSKIKGYNQLLKIRYFGKKSFQELEIAIMAATGLDLTDYMNGDLTIHEFRQAAEVERKRAK